MFLKKIYISGFKSFAKPIQLNFNNSVNAIVGPNGSGKSNISDAIRFVLGEQRTSQMRSQKMEDIIFSGTELERPRGAAEVRLTLDRDSEPDLIITRKLFRTGESSYLINGKRVRLKDIQKIFFDTGLGKNGYSIVSQGGIETIVEASPQTIRELVEEAVGIAGYKAKRIETERHLESTRESLDRILDILDEVESQLKPLKSRSEKARRYLEINKTLQAIDLVSFYYEHESYQEKNRKISIDISRSDLRIDELQKESEAVDQEYLTAKKNNKLYREKALELETQFKSIGDALLKLNEKRVREETILEREQYENKTLNKEIKRLETEIDHLKKKYVTLKKTKTDYIKSFNQEEDNRKSLEIELKNLEEDVSKYRLKRQENELERNQLFKQAQTINQELVQLKVTLEQKKQKLAEIEKNIEEIELSSDQYDQLLIENDEQTKIYQSLKEKIEQCKSRELLKRDELEKKITAREQLKAQHINLKSQLANQQNIKESYSGYNRAVRAVLKYASGNQAVYGVVGELFSVSKQYALSIQTVLGARAQNIVVRDAKIAGEMIEFLKRGKLGRVTFLPLNTLRYQRIPDKTLREMQKHSGYIGIASDLIRFEDFLRPVFESLLSRTVVVSNFEQARLFRKEFKYLTIVTLDGEIFYPGGAVVGGTTGKEFKTSLFVNFEIERLEEALTKNEEELEQRTQQVKRLEKSLKEIDSKKRDLDDRYYKQVRVIDSLKEKISNWKEEKAIIQKQYFERESLSKEINQLSDEIAKLELKLNSKHTTSTNHKEKEDNLQSDIEIIQKQLTNSNISLSTLKQKIENIDESATRLSKKKRHLLSTKDVN